MKYYGLFDLQLDGIKANYVEHDYQSMIERGADRVITLDDTEENEEYFEMVSDVEIVFHADYMPIELTKREMEIVENSDEIGLLTTVSGIVIEQYRVDKAYEKIIDEVKRKSKIQSII